jgi:hypothetical protein
MACIFCGNEGATREHIYPRAWGEWLAPHAESFTNTRAAGEGRAEPVSAWESRDLDVVVRCVCADCNNGWMNRLDGQAEEAIKLLSQGEVVVRVVDAALPLFAAWATKMALVMECLFPRFIVPQEVRDHLYREQRPHPSVRIWVATMETWDGETRTTPMSLKSGPEMGGLEQAYLVTFRILHLVVQVIVPLHDGVRPDHDEWGETYSEAAWPREEPLVMPLPRERMLRNDEDYYRLTKSFRTGNILRA